MKKSLKRQVMAALAATAVLGAVGGAVLRIRADEYFIFRS